MAARKRATATSSAAQKKNRLQLDLQLRSRATHIPSRARFLRWANAALAAQGVHTAAALTLCVVGPTEMRTLNREYRNKDYATNVLSFPFEKPEDVVMPVQLLGDIVLCAQTVAREARTQGKNTDAHWAHLTVHGVLHLLGLDHQTTRQANAMEGKEIAVLASLGFTNPYEQP